MVLDGVAVSEATNVIVPLLELLHVGLAEVLLLNTTGQGVTLGQVVQVIWILSISNGGSAPLNKLVLLYQWNPILKVAIFSQATGRGMEAVVQLPVD